MRLQVLCPACDTPNQVPQERLSQDPHCDVCQSPLFETLRAPSTPVRNAPRWIVQSPAV